MEPQGDSSGAVYPLRVASLAYKEEWEEGKTMTRNDKIFIAVCALIAFGFGIAVNFAGHFYSPVGRSAVYEIPMQTYDPKRGFVPSTPWKMTVYRGELYTMIKAPKMPEDGTR